MGENGATDHFLPISVDQANTLAFWSLPKYSQSGEGWSTLLAFPVWILELSSETLRMSLIIKKLRYLEK
jgi:hypothetical protein